MGTLRKFIIGAVLAFICTQAGVMHYLTRECSTAGYRFGYMAYCQGGFGYYEHGAMYYGIEPEAVASLQKAEVLFFGNSRLQVAFSTTSVSDFFRRLKLPYYLFGFSYNETDPLPDVLLEKYHLKPKLVVVNADHFFSGDPSEIGQQVLTGRQNDEYVYKKVAQTIHAWICGSPLGERLCDPKMTIFRSRETGAWETDRWIPANTPLGPPGPRPGPEEVDRYITRARAFQERVQLPARCVVLTVIPSNGEPVEIGQEIAARLHMPFISPDVADLLTIDLSHLAPDSAKRWSKAFVTELEPLLARCGLGREPGVRD